MNANFSKLIRNIIVNEKIKLASFSIMSLLTATAINFYGVAKIGLHGELDLYFILYSISLFSISAVIWPLTSVIVPLGVKKQICYDKINYCYLIFGLFSIFLFFLIVNVYLFLSPEIN
ncbi:hypothetical protein AB4356_06570, partial [Vibrio lentus]